MGESLLSCQNRTQLDNQKLALFYTTARGSIPGGNGVFSKLHIFRKGLPSLNDLAVEGT